MITQARFKNYKLLRDVTLDLGRLNVIVGRNGIGKSSVLEALDLFGQIQGRPRKKVRPLQNVDALFRGDRSLAQLASRPDASEIQIGVRWDDDAGVTLRAELIREEPDSLETVEESFYLRLEKPGGSLEVDLEEGETKDLGPLEAALLSHEVRSTLRLKLDAEAIAAAHYSPDDVPHVSPNGAGLASALQYLHGLNDGTSGEIMRALRGVLPQVSSFRLKPATVREQDLEGNPVSFKGVRFELKLDGIGWIPASQLSEGTLLALGLVTLLHYRPPRLLLLDDIDKGLHPLAQREVIAVLKAILAQRPELQVIATSHSPFVLDALAPEEVFIAGPVSLTESRIRRLDSHPGWQKRQDYMHPGEFWTLVGEDWVGSATP